MNDIENPTSGRAPQAKRNQAPRRAARRRQAGGDSTEKKRASAKEDDPGEIDVIPPISEVEADKLGAVKEYWAFTGAQGILIRSYNEATPEEKAKLVDDYITKKDAFLFKAADTYATAHGAVATSEEVTGKMKELSEKFYTNEQANARRALKMKGGAEEFLQTKSTFIKDVMRDSVYGEMPGSAPAAAAPAAQVESPKNEALEPSLEKKEKPKRSIQEFVDALPFKDALLEEQQNFVLARTKYVERINAGPPYDGKEAEDISSAYELARDALVAKIRSLASEQEQRVPFLEKDLSRLFMRNEEVEISKLVTSAEKKAVRETPIVPKVETPDASTPAEPPAESEADPKKKKIEKTPPAASTEIEGGPFDIHKGVGQPISSLERPNNFGGATPNTFPLGDLKLESLHPDTLDRLRIPNGEYAEIEGLPKPPEEAAAENPDAPLPPEMFGVPEGTPPASERVPLRDQTERARETLTIDQIFIRLNKDFSPRKSGLLSKFQRAEQAYKGHLLQKQRAGKELRLGADAVKLREQYIEARNDLLFSVAQMMRPGAGYVPANEAERNRSPEKQWIDFTMADVAHAFLANEQQELGGADTSFDAVYSILREPVLIRALGPSILKDEAFAGQYGTSMLDKMLNPNTEQFAPGLTDQSVVNEFDDARLEFYAALIRKMQKSSANRNALGDKDARFKDFRRSWLDRNDPIFQFNRGRQGFEDRYEKAFKALDKAMKQNVYIDEATRNEARRQFKQLITNEESIENDIERDRLSRQKRGRVRPLADAIRTNGWNAERFIGSAAQSIGRRFPPESAGEPSDEGGEEAAPAPEHSPSAPEAAAAPAYEVKEGETMTVAFENWLPTMPEGVRNRLLSGLRIDRELPNRSIAIEMLKELGAVRDMVTSGARFIFSQRGSRQGLYLLSPNGQRSVRLTDELGKNLIESPSERL